MENNDDGSLGFLNIQPDEDRKYFHCEEITQQKLLNIPKENTKMSCVQFETWKNLG